MKRNEDQPKKAEGNGVPPCGSPSMGSEVRVPREALEKVLALADRWEAGLRGWSNPGMENCIAELREATDVLRAAPAPAAAGAEGTEVYSAMRAAHAYLSGQQAKVKRDTEYARGYADAVYACAAVVGDALEGHHHSAALSAGAGAPAEGEGGAA